MERANLQDGSAVKEITMGFPSHEKENHIMGSARYACRLLMKLALSLNVARFISTKKY